MSRYQAWRRLWRIVGHSRNTMKSRRWYKKMICRLNRRKAKQDPKAIDKRLDPWEIT